MAEECFVGGLEDSEGNRSVPGVGRLWARRMIIQNAIQMIRPRLPTRAVQPSSPRCERRRHDRTSPEIAAIVGLPAFERFVFVMSVLERYSDQECALLLGCTRGEVVAARTRALRQIRKIGGDLHRSL